MICCTIILHTIFTVVRFFIGQSQEDFYCLGRRRFMKYYDSVCVRSVNLIGLQPLKCQAKQDLEILPMFFFSGRELYLPELLHSLYMPNIV